MTSSEVEVSSSSIMCLAVFVVVVYHLPDYFRSHISVLPDSVESDYTNS